jgi:hypothetical protein
LAFVALLDANVLYPAYLRDALLRLAEAEIYQVRWSRKILDEMARNVLENNPNLSEERIERLVRIMESFPGSHGYWAGRRQEPSSSKGSTPPKAVLLSEALCDGSEAVYQGRSPALIESLPEAWRRKGGSPPQRAGTPPEVTLEDRVERDPLPSNSLHKGRRLPPVASR